MSRRKTVVVAERADALGPLTPVTAETYLAGEAGSTEAGLSVINLCPADRYLSEGYYVSLLADARGHAVLPNVDTLEALRTQQIKLRLVIGSDLVDEIPRWHEGHRVPSLAPPLVVGRGGHGDGSGDISMPAVSSTEVRRRLRAGESVEALVPRAVRRYVTRHGLYRGA